MYLPCYLGNGSKDLDKLLYLEKVVLYKLIYVFFLEKTGFHTKIKTERNSVAQVHTNA